MHFPGWQQSWDKLCKELSSFFQVSLPTLVIESGFINTWGDGEFLYDQVSN
jgi:hypothetical protein